MKAMESIVVKAEKLLKYTLAENLCEDITSLKLTKHLTDTGTSES